MKRRSGKIAKVLKLAAAQERRCGLATGSIQLHLDKQIQKLGELNAYRQGYAEKSRILSSVSPIHWCDYQSFIGRLDQAVRSQQQIVNDSEQNLETHRRHWMVKRRRMKSLEQVLERYRREEAAHTQRLQQRIQDDLPILEGVFQEKA